GQDFPTSLAICAAWWRCRQASTSAAVGVTARAATRAAAASRAERLKLALRCRRSRRVASGSASMAGLEPRGAVPRQHAPLRFLVEREVVRVEHIAPAAVGALEEEAVRAALEERVQHVSAFERLLAHAVELRLARDALDLGFVHRHVEEGGDTPHLG